MAAAKIPRGKRSDPKKLAREGADIAKDKAKRNRLPPLRVPNPFVEEVLGRISQRRRKSSGFGSVPQVRGALHVGRRKPDRTA